MATQTQSTTGTVTTADGYTLIVDIENVSDLSGRRITMRGSDYPSFSSADRVHYVHRHIAYQASGAIMDANPKLLVHHINDDKFDDRLCNLQLVTTRQHEEIHRKRPPQNGKTYKGTHHNVGYKGKPKAKPWRGYVRYLGKMCYTAYFATEYEASLAVDLLIQSLGLTTAYLNHPPKENS